MKYFFLTCVYSLSISLNVYAQKPFQIQKSFETFPTPQQPNYGLESNWCALPWVKDMADKVPNNPGAKDEQDHAMADVFFIHPTIYTREPTDEYGWNASIKNQEINQTVDNTTILNQATVFNGCAKIYAPRYRQAHYTAYTSPDTASRIKALDLAYEDVKSAFEFYLANYHKGRPIIIAGHSQGTTHAKRLIHDYFDNKPLHKYLVQAYLVGMAVSADEYEQVLPSKTPTDVGTFVSWNTFHKGYVPTYYYSSHFDKAFCTNPLSWDLTSDFVDRAKNLGGVGLKFSFVENPTGAQSKNGLLWIEKPYIKGRIFIHRKIWHVADYNLFWMNIRTNAQDRVEAYLKTH